MNCPRISRWMEQCTFSLSGECGQQGVFGECDFLHGDERFARDKPLSKVCRYVAAKNIFQGNPIRLQQNVTKLLSVTVVLLCTACTVQAGSIPITNQGFESLSLANPDDYSLNSIPGWTVSVNGFASTFRPGGEFPGGIPEGRNVAAVGGGSSISQNLSGMLTADTSYSLSVGIGNRASFFYGYTVSLSAGGVVLATDAIQASDYSPFAGAYGTFITPLSVIYYNRSRRPFEGCPRNETISRCTHRYLLQRCLRGRGGARTYAQASTNNVFRRRKLNASSLNPVNCRHLTPLLYESKSQGCEPRSALYARRQQWVYPVAGIVDIDVFEPSVGWGCGKAVERDKVARACRIIHRVETYL